MMAYAGPIMRTYYSMAQYSQDASIMAMYGYQAVNVEQYNVTNGLSLTLILIFGLLLTPFFCIGVVILCFLPLAFSKRYNVSYILQSPYPVAQLPNPYTTIPLQSPHTRPLAQPEYPQPTPPQAYQMAPPGTQQQTLPVYRSASPGLNVRLREGLAAAAQVWRGWTAWQRVLVVCATIAIVALALTGAIFMMTQLAHPGA